jgi:regulatory protein
MQKEKKEISKSKLFIKLGSYCAYQERCLFEVNAFIDKYEISQKEREELIGDLVAQKYLDDLRYAKSVARGKFNFKHWGKAKIKFYLINKGIEESYIRKALLEIKKVDYTATCAKLVESKRAKLASKELDEFTEKQTIIASLMQKGFEYDVIKDVL